MYVGRKYTQHAAERAEYEFHCAYCNHAAACDIYGIGQGTGKSAYFLDDAGAQARASHEAQREASKDAPRSLGLVRCPNCHRRNRGAVAHFWLWSLLEAIATMAVVIVICLVQGLFEQPGAAFIAYGAPVVALATILFLRMYKLSTVEQRVYFKSDEGG